MRQLLRHTPADLLRAPSVLGPPPAGYSQAAVLGRSHALLQGPDTDPVVLADIAAAMDEGRPVVAEILVYRSDGSSFWCQVRTAGSSPAFGCATVVPADVRGCHAASSATQHLGTAAESLPRL